MTKNCHEYQEQKGKWMLFWSDLPKKRCSVKVMPADNYPKIPICLPFGYPKKPFLSTTCQPQKYAHLSLHGKSIFDNPFLPPPSIAPPRWQRNTACLLGTCAAPSSHERVMLFWGAFEIGRLDKGLILSFFGGVGGGAKGEEVEHQAITAQTVDAHVWRGLREKEEGNIDG